ncbi:MAG: type II toxin-antitoxin system VapC family toxin [Ignavibacteriales bacterium]|nr:type II toxin-antitoxin system VapC family toxin [Ignavibacteriales bacterium]
MSNYFFDSNIFIYYLKDEPAVTKFFELIRNENPIIYCSFISKLELLSLPNLTDGEIKNIEDLLKEFIKVGYNSSIENLTILIRKKKQVKLPDAIIAASAIYTNSKLVTRNIKDFQSISGLELINPFE